MRCNATAAISGADSTYQVHRRHRELKPMRKLSKSLILGIVLSQIPLPLFHAQTATTAAPADTTSASAKAAPSVQTPDDATKKITELVQAGKYTEAQLLTTGLLVAYPNDQRLIKAKALIEKLLAPAGQANAAPGNSQPTPPAASANAEQLTGMDKVDYIALIVLARQAQRTTDLDEQNGLLKQFMDQSSKFLQQHPAQVLLWQLRATAAISLDDAMAGFEAGQQLIALGAADSGDQSLLQLLGQLKNKGWLDKQLVERQVSKTWQDANRQTNYDWIVGTWGALLSFDGLEALPDTSIASHVTVTFSKSGSVIEGLSYYDGVKPGPREANTLNASVYKGTILDSGEIHWEWTSPLPGGSYDWVWIPALSFESRNDNRQMTIVFSSSRNKNMGACTLLFTRVTPK
jgi:hypothetical protein